MITKQDLVIEVTKGEHTYRFSMPIGSPFGQARDAAIDILNQVISMVQHADAKLQEKIKESQKEQE